MLEKKIVVVTGGASGLGLEIAERLLKERAVVVIFDFDKKKLDNTNNSFIKYNVDVTSQSQIQEAIDSIIKKFGTIDILINNAGAIHNEPLINILSKKDKKHSLKNFKNYLNINLTSVFIVSAIVIEKMILSRLKGVVINISSISAQGNSGQTVYSAAKAGVEAMTKVWSKELGVHGIRVVAIAPGFMNTKSTKLALGEVILQDVKSRVPLKTLGDSNDVAEAVLFAIKSKYINGKVIQVDGGITL